MTRRSARSAFAPNAFVFPGGVVDEAQDRSPAARARTLGLDDDGLRVTALRELFEEAGILIARGRDGSPIPAARIFSGELQTERERVRNGDLPFAELLSRHDWFADARALTLFSHWITPPSEPRRYDTHFFFAVAPPDQAGSADTFETHDGLWIEPRAALARYHSGTFHLVYATVKHLERLRAFDSVEAAEAFARNKPILTVLPTATPEGDFEMPAGTENAW